MPANSYNSAVATGLEKVSCHSNPKERQYQRMLKLPHNCTHLTLLKILQARIQKYMNHELPDAQGVFRKDRGTRVQIANICWIIEKATELQKMLQAFPLLKVLMRAFFMVQWLRIHLPMQGTWV